MKLEHLLHSASSAEQWAQTFAWLEQYLNPGSPSGYSSHRVGISDEYNPDHHRQRGADLKLPPRPVHFPYYSVGQDDLQIMPANPSPELLRFLGDSATPGLPVRFVAHPDELKMRPICRKQEGEVAAYLTASTRTVLAATGDPLFLKLDYSGMIGRCPRRLDLPELCQSAFFSTRLDAWSQAHLLSPSFAFLPESIGILWKSGADGSDIGMIARETQPRPQLADRSIYVPFFALYTPDCSSPQDPTLLVQIIRAHTTSGVTPHDLILHMTGLIFEAVHALLKRQRSGDRQRDKFRNLADCHGQNLLLELDGAGYPRRVILRDLQHLYPLVLDDGDVVDYLDELNPFCKVLDMRREPGYVSQKASQLIDGKLGGYVIKPLLAEFAAHFGGTGAKITADVRAQFRHKLGLACEILPQGVWYRRTDGIELDARGRIRLEQGQGAPVLRE